MSQCQFLGPFPGTAAIEVHFRRQLVLSENAEKGRVMLAIQQDVESDCLHVNSCADADGVFDENLRRFVRRRTIRIDFAGLQESCTPQLCLSIWPGRLSWVTSVARYCPWEQGCCNRGRQTYSNSIGRGAFAKREGTLR